MSSAAKSRLSPDAPCSCGSKKPYRNCCKPKRDRGRIFLFIGVVIGGVFVAKLLFGPEPAIPPAPAGKVWSEEHGHYHDAPGAGAPLGGQPNAGINGAAPGTSALPLGGGGAAQPQGEAPPGKVWSAEHGHYHDAPAGAAPAGMPGSAPANSGILPAAGQTAPPGAVQNIPQPAGAAPPGKVWSSVHGHWHDAPKP